MFDFCINPIQFITYIVDKSYSYNLSPTGSCLHHASGAQVHGTANSLYITYIQDIRNIH